MRERFRQILQWTLPVCSVSTALVWWVVNQPLLATLGVGVGVLQVLMAMRRRIPLVVPRRRKPIVIEQLRWPRG